MLVFNSRRTGRLNRVTQGNAENILQQLIDENYNKSIKNIEGEYKLICPWPWNMDFRVRKLLDVGYSLSDILYKN